MVRLKFAISWHLLEPIKIQECCSSCALPIEGMKITKNVIQYMHIQNIIKYYNLKKC